MSIVVRRQDVPNIVSALDFVANSDGNLSNYLADFVSSGKLPQWLWKAASRSGQEALRVVRSRLSQGAAIHTNRKLGPSDSTSGTILPKTVQQVSLGNLRVPAATGNMVKTTKGRKGKGSANKRPKSMVPRTMGFGSTNAVCLRGLAGVSNIATNGTNYIYPVAIATTVASSSSTCIGSLFGTALTNWAAIYRQWRLSKMTATWVTGAPNTVSGNLMLGFDPDPLAGVPSAYQQVVRHSSSFNSPIFQNGHFVWTPTTARDKQDRFTASATGRVEGELSFGTLQLMSQNSAANGVSLGIIELEIWVKFSDPC